MNDEHEICFDMPVIVITYLKFIEHQYALYISEIICERAHVLFGMILRLLCSQANITQEKLRELGKDYRDSLFERGLIKPGYVVGALDQDAISRVISGERWASYDQVSIWLKVIENRFNDLEYKQVRSDHNLLIYDLSDDLKVDMFHLAGFGAPNEIVASYEKRLSMVKEYIFPKITKSGGRRSGSYSKSQKKPRSRSQDIPRGEYVY